MKMPSELLKGEQNINSFRDFSKRLRQNWFLNYKSPRRFLFDNTKMINWRNEEMLCYF